MRLIRFAPAAAALAAAPFASAQYFDNFESYAVNSALEGQGSWHQWDSTTNGVQPFARVYDQTLAGGIAPYDGTKMARIIGTQIVGNAVLADTVTELGNGPYDLGTTWTLTAQVYVPSAFSGNMYFIVLDDYNDTPTGPYDWAVQMHFDSATASVLSDAVSAGNIILSANPFIVFDQWVELKVEIDLVANIGRNYYDGTAINEYTWTAQAGPKVVDAIDLYPGTDLTTEVYYDAFSMQPGIAGTPIGGNYCNTNANSTGSSGRIDAFGSAIVSNNDVTLVATQLPQNSFLFFITSTTQTQINNPGGSQGNLCVGGSIGRYVGPGQIQNSGSTGTCQLVINTNAMPQPNGAVAAMPGQTWNFQAWHRDVVGGVPTSNFTDATAVFFQ